MADNKQNFPADGIDRQTEEVRDLFNLLTKTAVTEQPELSSESMKETIEIVTIEESTQEDAVSEEEIIDPISVEEETIDVFDESLIVDKTVVPYTPIVIDGATADDYDDGDHLHELPPLVLSAPYDDEDDEDAEDRYADFGGFVLSDEEKAKEAEVDPQRMRRNPFVAFWHALCSNVPLPDDSKGEILRKSVFWLAIVLVTGALTYILYNVWWLPAFTKGMYTDVAQNYNPTQIGTVQQSEGYPEGMQSSFKALYDRNPQIRGWLSYHAEGKQDFLNIEYPVMYSGDNEKYLKVDFNGNQNKNGALFFDMRALLRSPEDVNSSLIIYGHNMASGQMLAGLNKFIGNVNNARVASTMTMNTLFANGQYKVFAVVITDESAAKEQYFNVRRTQFADDEEFLSYVTQLRERSLFDYPVDVAAGDELLLLSTCTAKSSAKIEDGRLTVIARKVRTGESSSVNTVEIVKNADVIMPYAWYIVQDKALHAYYTQGAQNEMSPSTTTATTTTSTTDSNPSDSTTSTDTTTTESTTTTTTTAATTTTTTTTTTSTTTSTTAESTTESTDTTTSTTTTDAVESDTSDESETSEEQETSDESTQEDTTSTSEAETE